MSKPRGKTSLGPFVVEIRESSAEAWREQSRYFWQANADAKAQALRERGGFDARVRVGTPKATPPEGAE